MDAFTFKQLGICSNFWNVTLIEYDDTVCFVDGGEPKAQGLFDFSEYIHDTIVSSK